MCSGLCETDNVNKAGYTPVMLAALTAAETPDDLEVIQQLLKLGDINACSRQVFIYTCTDTLVPLNLLTRTISCIVCHRLKGSCVSDSVNLGV